LKQPISLQLVPIELINLSTQISQNITVLLIFILVNLYSSTTKYAPNLPDNLDSS